MTVLAAERIKLTSVCSPWWCTAIVVVLGLGFAGLVGFSANSGLQSYNDMVARGDQPTFEPYLPALPDTLGGVSGFGITVLMILAALAVTSEYRFGVVRTTFQAIPNRSSVLVAKAGLLGVFSAVLTIVLTFGAYAIAKATAGADAGANLSLSTGADWRAVYGIPIYALLAVILAVGVGALLRQTAGAIALLLLWPLLIESLFNLFGETGRDIMPFLPFTNINNFLGAGGTVEFHWGPWGSLIYFAVFVFVVFGAALFVVDRRDA
ncbi:ABC transporter permease [Rhodococcus rhodnii]|uniref:ABC transporter permease n=2 Tax=Rhodococcus rhodnii TaxID=38312 RepID=R7WV11_9NOCA|nr:ABC transporter permease [Rhodococcus rhodnii]EOM77979.1 ABC transporter permease [Rhodococcus rhodnii LMG 5362]TXG92049.1 ABC transporter permease [Rhodococcus rhodnii]